MIISTESAFSLTIAVGGNTVNDQCVSNMKVDHSINELEFEHPAHLTTLISGLRQLRHKGQLTDVALKAEDQIYHAHRVVLSACSDYFRAMFTDPMRERSQTEVFLAGVSASGCQHLLDYIYTSKLSLSLNNIQEVLSAATHLQVQACIDACSNYLQSQLDVENCVDLVTIAENYSLGDLREKVYRFMSENLSSFSNTSSFVHRLSSAQLEYLLASDYPVDVPEERVLEVLLEWLDVQSSSRMAHAHKLLKYVNFDEIHPVRLRAILEKKLSSSLPKSFLSRVQTLSEEKESNTDMMSSTFLLNSRGMEEALLKVGGFGSQGVTNQVSYFLPSQQKWSHLTQIPHVECCNFGCVVHRNDLFVVGGCFNQSLQEHIHPFGFKFSPRQKKWISIAPMLRERCRFPLSAFGKNLFVFGGCSEHADGDVDNGVHPLEHPAGSSCEKYDIDTNEWTELDPLPDGLCLSQHAAVRFQNKILVSGGIDHDTVMNRILVFHPTENHWESSTRFMTIPRADHVMLVWQNVILFCGGWTESDQNPSGRTLVDAIESYDPSAETWTTLTHIPTPRYHAGIALVKDSLYVVGGFENDAHFHKGTNIVEKFDLVEKQWSKEESYPQDIWEHICASVHVPRSHDDIDVLPKPE